MHLVAAPGQKLEAGARVALARRLRQGAPPAGHHGVRRQHERFDMAAGDGLRLSARQALRRMRRKLSRLGNFLDVGRVDQVGDESDQLHKVAPARRCRGQH